MDVLEYWLEQLLQEIQKYCLIYMSDMAMNNNQLLFLRKYNMQNNSECCNNNCNQGRNCPLRVATPAAAPQAQAVERGEVLVTVSGFTGSGKSAIAGEIEILCRALGLQVEWPDGESEKNMTHADWTAALELYKPRVRIVENNIPRASKEGPTA